MSTSNPPYKGESHLRSVLKGFSWRLIAFIDTLLVAMLVTWIIDGEPHMEAGLTIAGVEFFIKIAIYYVHERVWQLSRKDGVITPLQTLFKTSTWRIVATFTTFIISGKVLGTFAGAALAIALTESISKFVLFYFHERLWYKIPLGTVRGVIKKE